MIAHVVAFAAMFLLDFVYARYTAAVADDRPVPAGLWAIGCILFSSVVTRSYVADWSTIISAGVGAFAGTYVSMKFKSWR